MTNWAINARTVGRKVRFASWLAGGLATIEGQSLVRPHSFEYAHELKWFESWARTVGRYLNLEIETRGTMAEGPCLLASNHISWIDVCVLYICRPIAILAKDEVATWPVLGEFTKKLQAIYVSRSNKFESYRSLPRIEDRLKSGGTVLVFPETTTTPGDELLPFKTMFYEAAVRTGVPVQPMTIQYLDRQGNVLTDVSYSGGDTFTETLHRTLSLDEVVARVTYHDCIDSSQFTRKELAAQSYAAISNTLGLDSH